jgi:DNA-binding winged helix-turn-helix (wHTH) protein/TolB-like protein/Flp pilus assembly protein TadD
MVGLLMSPRPLSFYEFGPFRINVTERLLQRGNELVPLSPKVFDTLLILVENHGHVVDKPALMQSLWPDTFVEESSLTQNISLLRRALGGGEADRHYIETIPKRGYRFIADVNQINGSGNATSAPTPSAVSISEPVELHVPQTFSHPPAQSIPNTETQRPYRRINLLVTAVAGIVLVGALITLVYRLRQRAVAHEGLAGKSIAVLPFKTIGTESENELLGLGMADAVINRLSRLEELSVLPTGSVFRYTVRDKDAITVGRELGVDGVLDGTIQRYGEMVRVTAQLIRVTDGKTVWSIKYDERQSDIFALQDSISEQLAISLVPEISASRKQSLWVKSTSNTEAYQAYLLGMHFWNRRTKENLAKAISHLEQAVEKDPNFGQAYAILADCYFLSGTDEYRSMTIDEATSRAESAANRALAIDENNAEAHTVKAGINIWRRQFSEASQEFNRALELKPTYAVAHLRYGYFLMWDMRLEEALSHMHRAQQLDPVSPIANAALGSMLLTARKFDESISYSQRALELEPGLLAPRINLAEAYLEKKMFPEAIRELEKVPDTDDDYVVAEKAYTYAIAGRKDEALKAFTELQRSVGTRGAPYAYARIYSALGDKDKAFEWLEKMNLNRMMQASLKYDSQLDLLRPDPRFNDFLKRHKLEHLLQE